MRTSMQSAAGLQLGCADRNLNAAGRE